jgi:PqqD family protein of HPr-rel-A system
MTARRPKVRTELTVVELDGEAVVYDEESMDVHRFNPSATVILGLLDGSATVDELAVDISDVFGQRREDVLAQLDELIRQLDEGHILEPV